LTTPRGKTWHFSVDVNSADWPELVQLPGVGETLARRIVESREQDGPFTDPSDLRRVRGIGPKTLQRIQPYLAPMPDRGAVAER
jgi:competence protein ComEA